MCALSNDVQVARGGNLTMTPAQAEKLEKFYQMHFDPKVTPPDLLAEEAMKNL